MNGRSGTMSPVSVAGSDWSGINHYQKSEPPFSPTPSTQGNNNTNNNIASPPPSVGSNGPLASHPPGGNGGSDGGGGDGGGGGPPPPNGPVATSPSSSVAARSSSGTLSDQNSKRYKVMEESLAMHYAAFQRFLHAPYQDVRLISKPNKAKDKLLRLSPTQFYELSTDVYDELLRRQQAMPSPGRPGPPRPDVPPFLPPRQEFHVKRNQARQKLASLQYQRFRDLATDVFRELDRRFPQFAEARGPPNGPPPPGHGPPALDPNGYPPPPRSQSRGPPPGLMARGYPSGGPPGSPMPGSFPPRKGSLASLSSMPAAPGANGDSVPLPKSFQSNTIVPNKSTLVEDDDDAAGGESDADARSDAFNLDSVIQSRRETTTTLGDGERKLLQETQSQMSSLQDKVQKLEELVRSKDEQIAKLQEEQTQSQVSDDERRQWEDLKQELQDKISKAEDLNSSLQLELDKVRTEQEDMERELRSQIDEVSRQSAGDPELQAKFDDLESRHKRLQAELQEQEQVTEEVRRQASDFLAEMKTLSEQSHSNFEREEWLSAEVRRLEDEVKQWKSRYAKAKTQLRHLRTSSVGIADSRPDVGALARENELLQQTGLVKDVHVTKFQMSVDELLHAARSDQSQLVVQQMKVVVMAVRRIMRDVETSQNHEDRSAPARLKVKGRVSATANNLITASRNFADSNGLSPVSLLDAAASHLSTAVIELVRLVKIRPTPADELEEEEDNISQVQSPGYFSIVPNHDRFSNNESIYSAMSPPSVHSRSDLTSHFPLPPKGIPNGVAVGGNNKPDNGYPVQSEDDHDLQELKIYLEDQTDGLVQSIQALVASIRAEEDLTNVRIHISAISSVVDNVLSSTEDLISRPGNMAAALRQRAAPVLDTLDNCRNRLIETAAEGEDAVVPGMDVAGKLPPIAFEIARETKELVGQLSSGQVEEYGDGNGNGNGNGNASEEDDFR